MRHLLAASLCLALVAGLASAAEPKADEIIKQLLGQAEAPERSAQELEAAYAAAIAKLAAGLAVDDVSQMSGPDRQLETLCHRASMPGREAHRVAAAKALVAELSKKQTKLGATRIIRHLERIGRAEAVPALTGLLGNSELREPARRALARNPAAAAAEALRAALPKADKPFRIGLIDALGLRRDQGAVKLLIAEAKSEDEEVHSHAIQALARISEDPTTDMVAIGKVLAHAAFAAKSPGVARAAMDAYLKLAEAVAARGYKRDACTMYRSLLGTARALTIEEDKQAVFHESVLASLFGHVKCAALVGLGRAGTAKEVDALVAALDGPAVERGAAREGLKLLEGEAASKAIAAKLKGADDATKVILLTVLGRRGDTAVVGDVIAALKANAEAVRIAAYEALGRLKSEAGIQPLLGALPSEKGATRDKAEWALSRIPGKKATNAILAALKNADKETKPVLLRSLGYRRDAATLPTLIAATKDPSDEARAAAFRAIAMLNDLKAIPVILDALRKETGKARGAAAYALRRAHGKEATAAIVQAARTAPPAALAPILRVLSWRDDPAAKGFLVANASSADSAVRAAAIAGLARLKDPAAVPAIIDAATKGEGEVRDTAVRTSLQYVDEIIQADAAAAEVVFSLALDRKIVPHHDERRQALRALGKVGGPDIIETIARSLRDRRVAGDAHSAVFAIAARLAKAGKKEQAVEALMTLARLSPDHGRIRRAQQELKKLGVAGELPQKVGFITRWQVCGPFPNARNALFATPLPPEKVAKVDLTKPVTAAGATCVWKAVHSTDPAGLVDLERLLKRNDEVAALMYAEVTVPQAMDVYLRLGYDEGCIAYVNGKRVHSRSGSRFRIDDQRAKARLVAGVNRILLKIVNLGPGWRACCRLIGTKGEPVPFTQSEK